MKLSELNKNKVKIHRKLFPLERIRVGDSLHFETGHDQKSFQCIQIPVTRVDSRHAYSGNSKFQVEYDPTAKFYMRGVEWTWQVYRNC